MKSQQNLVVITGAASGIGRALALEYLAQGDRVALIDLDQTNLESIAAAFSKEQVLICKTDVSQEAQVQLASETILKAWGKPDIWINNAGVAKLGSFEEISTADFEKVMSVNFNGVVYGTRAALSSMMEPERGTIVNVASVNGTVPAPFMSSYVAAKHAVVGFTRSLQLEKDQSQSPLRILLVCPGWVKTPIMSPQAGFQFPSWLEWAIVSPEAAAKEIVQGIQEGKKEMTPTLTGKAIRKLYHLAPGLIESSTRLLAAKNWKEALGLSKINRDDSNSKP